MVNDFGRGTTNIAISYLRGDGSKDIDSQLYNCSFQFLNIAVLAQGCNLQVNKNLFSFCWNGYVAQQLTENENRGHIISNNRFHVCGAEPSSDVSDSDYPSCIKIIGKYSRANKIHDNYADALCHRFFFGQLLRASQINNNTLFRLSGDVIVIDNSVSNSAEEVFQIDNNILANDDPVTKLSGYFIRIKGAVQGSISGNVVTNLRKGGIYCESCQGLSIINNSFKNINRLIDTDGNIYDAVYFDANSSHNLVSELYLRNSYSTNQCRSVIYNAGNNNSIYNIFKYNVNDVLVQTDTAVTSGTFTNKTISRLETYSNSIPTTGTYKVGDIIWNDNPNSNSYVGWVCTVAGTPGTWRVFGKID